MKNLSRFSVMAGGVAIAAALLSSQAFAGHGKAGLWQVSMQMAMAGMPKMPSLPPEQLARMKAMGVHMPSNNVVTTEHCMTAAEVNSSSPPAMRQNKNCKMENMKTAGNTFTADMICNGDFQGTGHLSVTYDNPEHYAGKMVFNGSAGGHPQNMTNTFEGRWVSTDCGSVRH